MDTSVLIRALALRAPYAQHLTALSAQRKIAAHELVYGELLIGDRSGRQAFLATYAQLRWAPLAAHGVVVELVRVRQLQGRGLSWIDAHLLASSRVSGWRLWTADEALAATARELGVGWEPL